MITTLQKMQFDEFTYPAAKDVEPTSFETWATQDSEVEPSLSPRFSMNCWEAVLLAGWQAKVIAWETIHRLYNRNDPKWEGEEIGSWEAQIGSFLMPNPVEWTDNPLSSAGTTPGPRRGDIVTFNGMDHVVVATGRVDSTGGTEVLSFWPPPDHWDRQAKLESVKTVTVQAVQGWWTVNRVAPPVIRFGQPPWA